eukprot:NODE_47_length_27404_cov_0.284270.p10 type:complete len:175 gc:universal NODE_47_length_27404_cov_0.284270:21924-22448(+)
MFLKIPTNPKVIASIFNTDKAFIIGNTNCIWPLFTEWYRWNSEIRNPFDTFVEEQLNKAFPSNLFYSHIKYKGAFLPFQQMSGLYFESHSNLSIHPVYGPWISLRALVLGENVPNVPEIFITSDQLKSIRKISLNPYRWENHVKIRKLLGSFTKSQKYEFTYQQLMYHYNRVLV